MAGGLSGETLLSSPQDQQAEGRGKGPQGRCMLQDMVPHGDPPLLAVPHLPIITTLSLQTGKVGLGYSSQNLIISLLFANRYFESIKNITGDFCFTGALRQILPRGKGY